MSDSMQAYDEAQALYLEGPRDGEDALDFNDRIEVSLLKKYPDLNAQGLLMTIIRRARRDLVAL